MLQVLLPIAAFLGFFVGGTSATCTDIQFDACLSKAVDLKPPCNLTEFGIFCSNVFARRQCIANLNCSVDDVGYIEVKDFGNFSNYILKSNGLDAYLILCDARLVLVNQTRCVFDDLTVTADTDQEWSLFPAVNLNFVRWSGDFCGFLHAYYELKYTTYKDKYGAEVALAVLNATLKMYELQQLKCPPYDRKIRFNTTKLETCFYPVIEQSCDSGEYCSVVTKGEECLTSLGLSIWDGGFWYFSNISRYIPYMFYSRGAYLDGSRCACDNLSVLNSTCPLINVRKNFTSGLDFTNISLTTFEDLCRYENVWFDAFYNRLINSGYSENVARILRLCTKKANNIFGCEPQGLSTSATTVKTVSGKPVNNHSPDVVISFLLRTLIATSSTLFLIGYYDI